MSKLATIKYAGQFSDEQINRLKTRLQAESTEHIEFDVGEDQSLIGGFIAQLDGKVYDFSLRCKLMSVQERLERP